MLYDNLSGLETLRFFARQRRAAAAQCGEPCWSAWACSTGQRPVRDIPRACASASVLRRRCWAAARAVPGRADHRPRPQAIRDFYAHAARLRGDGRHGHHHLAHPGRTAEARGPIGHAGRQAFRRAGHGAGAARTGPDAVVLHRRRRGPTQDACATAWPMASRRTGTRPGAAHRPAGLRCPRTPRWPAGGAGRRWATCRT